MNYATFIAQYDEFAAAPQPLVEAKLADATALTPASVWGTLQSQGIGLRAAQALALSPFARNLALVAKDGSTVYDDRLTDLIEIVALGGMVI